MTALDDLRKKYGKNVVTSARDTTIEKIDTVSSGSFGLDRALGIGGFPVGRITVLYGPYSGGKSTVALHAMANAQKKFPSRRTEYIDAENSFEWDRARAMGVDVDRCDLSQPSSGEEAWDTVEALCRDANHSLIVLDSVAALVPQFETENDMDKSTVGLIARLTTKAMRKIGPLVAQSQTCLLLINQIRTVSKGQVMMEGMPGGYALEHNCSVIVRVARTEWIDQGAEIVGIRSKFEVRKNKCAPPKKAGEFTIYFDRGVCREAELLDLATKAGLIKTSGAWYAHEGRNVAQGRERAVRWLATQPALQDKIVALATTGELPEETDGNPDGD